MIFHAKNLEEVIIFNSYFIYTSFRGKAYFIWRKIILLFENLAVAKLMSDFSLQSNRQTLKWVVMASSIMIQLYGQHNDRSVLSLTYSDVMGCHCLVPVTCHLSVAIL